MDSFQPSDWKKTFFLIWTGQAFSLFGSELVQFALVWHLTKITGSASVLAIASFSALLPRVLLLPFTGALVDRWNRQRIMIFADAFIAFFTMLLALLFWLGYIQVWHIYVIMFIRSLGSGFHWPAMQASTSLMVPKDQLTRISGLNQTLRGALGIAAPLVAALLLEYIPMFGILSIDVLTAILAISPLLIIKIPQPASAGEAQPFSIKQVLGEVRIGFKYLTGWKGLFYLSITATILNFLLNPGFTFIPLLVTSYFKRSVIDLSLLESVFSIGIIFGGVVLGAWGGFKKNIQTIMGGIIGTAIGVFLIAMPSPQNFVLAIIGMGITGFMQPIANGPLFAVLQRHVEPQIQGRVFSTLESMVSAMMPVSMVIAAPVAEHIGIRGWLFFGGVGCLVLGISGFFIPALVHLEDAESIKAASALSDRYP